MTIDHAIAPSQLMAEIAEIDVLLMQYEDWRALLQLESREKQGDAVRSINGDTLKALLLESLSVNPLFARRQLLLADLEKTARDLQRLGPRTEVSETPAVQGDNPKPTHDDLTRITGIDARLAKRLKILDVRSFVQIANWTPDDIAYVANTLGLDQLIVTQDWIGQAALLAQSRDGAVPASNAWVHAGAMVHARNDAASAPPAPAAETPVPPKASVEAAKPTPAVKPVETPATVPTGLPAAADEKSVAAAALVSPVLAPLQVKPDVKVAGPQPSPEPAHSNKPLAAPAAAVVPVALLAEADESWKKIIPAFPLAARSYKTAYIPFTAPPEPAPEISAQPEKMPLPTMPLAARHYAGAVLESKHDVAAYSSLVPAKPLAAPAYRLATPDVPPVPVAPAVTVPAARPVAPNAAAPPATNGKAADILHRTLPPLPLRPSAPAAPPPKPQTQMPAQPPVVAQPPAQPAAAASTQSEALLLAVVAARSPLVAGASPPPLPAEAKNGKAAPPVQPATAPQTPPLTRPAHVIPAAAPPPMLDDVEPRSRQAAVEARVTIKRAEEALSNTVLRTPGGTEVYLGARRQAQTDEFDGTSYAAYRGSIEEASVQIVRRPPATKTPDGPPPLAAAVASAAQAAAQAAAQSAVLTAAQSAAKVIQSRPPVPDVVEGASPGGPSTMGRFLKALTGQ
jgi:predicted flap endonuclease-1-like 5' DNA nuclease